MWSQNSRRGCAPLIAEGELSVDLAVRSHGTKNSEYVNTGLNP